MRKILAILGAASLAVLSLSGCASSNVKTDDFCSEGSRFKTAAKYGNNQYIYVDTETGIQYFCLKEGYWAFGSALLDENGEPIKMEVE